MSAICFLKKEPPKNNFFIFLKSHCFAMGDPIDKNFGVWRNLRDSSGLSKKCGFATFPEL